MKAFTLEELVFIRDALSIRADELEAGANFDYDKLHNYTLYKNLHAEFQQAINEYQT